MSSAKLSSGETKAQWEMLKSKRSLWLFPTLAVVFIIVSAVFILLPLFQDILAMRDENKMLGETLERLTVKREQLQSLHDTELTRQLAVATKALPNSKPVLPLLGILGVIPGETKMTLLQYSLAPGGVASEEAEVEEVVENSPGELSVMPVEVTLDGTFEDVYGFLLRLKNTSPFVNLLEMSLSGFEQEGGMPPTAPIALESQMQIYYSLPPSTIGKMSDPLPTFGEAEEKTLRQLEALTTPSLDGGIIPGLEQERENPFVF
jgi:hypothetical protein